MSTPGRTQVTDAEPTVREQLIAGTVRLIDHDGLGDLSVRRMATESGRSTMCLYTKFTNRQGLLEAVYEHLGADLLHRLDVAQPTDALADFVRDHRRRYAFLVEVDPELIGLPPRLRGQLVAQLVQAVGDGDLDAGAEVLAQVHGRALLATSLER